MVIPNQEHFPCRTGRPIRFVLERGDDMLITAGRHPLLGRYKVREKDAWQVPGGRAMGLTMVKTVLGPHLSKDSWVLPKTPFPLFPWGPSRQTKDTAKRGSTPVAT